MSETNEPTSNDEGTNDAPTFTQADVDRLVSKARAEERRKATERYADYDELRTRAEGAKTLEDRVAEIERTARESEGRALRAEVANDKGLTPGQARRLVGATREELEADADQLLADIGAQRSTNNIVPNEGNNPQPGSDPMREFARQVFTRATAD